VTVEHSTRRIQRDTDAMGFLDMEGVPRNQRSHTILQSGEQLIARYEIPRGSIDFVLSGPSDAPFALDAGGERVLLADLSAKRAGAWLNAGNKGAAIVSLAQAVHELDFVLELIPPSEDRVPLDAFQNPRGIQAFDREPGRFSRDRLTAYRNSLDAQRDELRIAPVKDTAILNAEFIAEEVRPLLVALAQDRSGEVRKSLRPRAEDYAQVFTSAALSHAHQYSNNFGMMASRWISPMVRRPKSWSRWRRRECFERRTNCRANFPAVTWESRGISSPIAFGCVGNT